MLKKMALKKVINKGNKQTKNNFKQFCNATAFRIILQVFSIIIHSY